MPDTPFIPACPTCGYDLTGTPQDTCPECGNPFERRLVWSGWYQRELSGWPRNWVLVAAVIAGFAYTGTPTRFPHGHPCVHFGAIWALAAAWVVLRRGDIMGRKPWLVLWLVLVAAYAPNRAGMTETHHNIAAGISAAIALAALAFAFIRDWRAATRGVCFGLGFLGVFLGAAFALFAAAALCGLLNDGQYGFLGNLPAGVWVNDLIAMAIGVVLAVASRFVWKLGLGIAKGHQPRSGGSQ